MKYSLSDEMPQARISLEVSIISSSETFLFIILLRCSVPASGAMDMLRLPFMRDRISADLGEALSDVIEKSTSLTFKASAQYL
ncbi:hypothetical protein BMS3Bbin06_01101 [bacterium BMS3Bbin06]|nr:hypothetical protein BMS3Bbin06_01101 [bacterium BMS3Bbin06]